MKLVASFRSGVLNQPIKQSSAVAFRALSAFSNQIINVEKFTPRQTFRDSEARHSLHLFVNHISQLITGNLSLSFNSPQKLIRSDVRTQFSHHRITALNLMVFSG